MENNCMTLRFKRTKENMLLSGEISQNYTASFLSVSQQALSAKN